MKKYLKRIVRLRIASAYRSVDTPTLRQLAEWVFDAPVLEWHLRLQVLLKCTASTYESRAELNAKLSFIVGDDKKLRQ